MISSVAKGFNGFAKAPSVCLEREAIGDVERLRLEPPDRKLVVLGISLGRVAMTGKRTAGCANEDQLFYRQAH